MAKVIDNLDMKGTGEPVSEFMQIIGILAAATGDHQTELVKGAWCNDPTGYSYENCGASDA